MPRKGEQKKSYEALQTLQSVYPHKLNCKCLHCQWRSEYAAEESQRDQLISDSIVALEKGDKSNRAMPDSEARRIFFDLMG